jgi:hypothetical protein
MKTDAGKNTVLMFNLLKTVICILIIAIGVTAQPKSKPSGLSSAIVFPAGAVSYSVRDGYRKYEDVRELEHIERDNLVMFGVSGGKRFTFKNPRLRIQSTLEFGWGSVIDDIYEDVPHRVRMKNGTITDTLLDVSMHDNLFTIGMHNELHILLPSTGKHFYFLSLGPGIGWSSFKRTGETADFGQSIDDYIIDNIWFSLNIGAGMDYIINKRRALSISYNFRIWRPVSYDDVFLFPMGVDYKEQFFTHILQAHILIMPHRGKFR